MATLSAPIDTKKSDKRRVSNDTLCSSNSSCVLQKRKQLHPLASSIKYKNNNNSNVKQRVLSAKYLRFKTLQNELNDANYHIAQLINENKLLKNLQKRQDHALAKYEGTDAEIPKMIVSHQEEVRILQTKYKNVRKTIKDLNEHIRSKDEELNSLRDQNKHLMSLCKNKNLEEREKLTKKVEELEDMLRQRDNTISTLNRKIVLESKNYKYKLATEMAKNKTLQKETLQAQAQIEDLTTMLYGKESNAEKKVRNASSERKKMITKLNSSQDKEEKPGSSGKKSNGRSSTSSLMLIEGTISEMNGAEINQNSKIQENDNKSNKSEDIESSTHNDQVSSALQLKNVVNGWQKKIIPDNLKENLNDYCLDVIENADSITKTVDKRTLDFQNSEKEMESLLSALKENDEKSKKLNRPTISPVLDFTNLFKNKDKNANDINKISFEKTTDGSPYREEFNGIKRQQKVIMASDVSSSSDDETEISKSQNVNFENNENNYDSDNALANNDYKISVESNRSSTSDLDDVTSSQKSRRSFKAEVANGDKEKLLAKLKAIDNGDSIEYTGVKKSKNDFIKELFG